jgi:hypothetical protein
LGWLSSGMATADHLQLESRPSVHERCPYCHDAMALEIAGFEQVICPSCGTPHHEACLIELGGCTVMGCSGARPRPVTGIEEVRRRIRKRVAKFVANHALRPDAPEVLARRALQPWICARCFREFAVHACARCGGELAPTCEGRGLHCHRCGEDFPKPRRSRWVRALAPYGWLIPLVWAFVMLSMWLLVLLLL